MRDYKKEIENFVKKHAINLNSDDYFDIIDERTWESEKFRTLYVLGEVNGTEPDDTVSTTSMIIEIMRWNREDDINGVPPEKRTPIIILIDSIGGDAFGTYELIRCMKESKTPIHTVNIGEASSAAGIILVHGKKRYALPGTRALVHSGSIGLGGNAEQVESQKKEVDKLRKRLEESLLSHTKITKKDYNKYASKDWHLFDEEQLEYGVVDEITFDMSKIFNIEDNNDADEE